jgi:predicted ABC-type sugar transport system permease subunit
LRVVTNGQTLFDLPESFLYLGAAKWLGVPSRSCLTLLIPDRRPFMRYHGIGRAIYAVGGNAEAARLPLTDAEGSSPHKNAESHFAIAGTDSPDRPVS